MPLDTQKGIPGGRLYAAATRANLDNTRRRCSAGLKISHRERASLPVEHLVPTRGQTLKILTKSSISIGLRKPRLVEEGRFHKRLGG